MEIECNFSKERETDFIKHATVSKKNQQKLKGMVEKENEKHLPNKKTHPMEFIQKIIYL